MSANIQRGLPKVFSHFFVFYNVIFVFVLILMLLLDPNSPITFMLFVLLFPILLFFSYSAWNQLVLLRQKDTKNWYFSWKTFFTQDNMLFFVTLALFVLAMNLALTRRALTFANLVFNSTRIIQSANATKGSQ